MLPSVDPRWWSSPETVHWEVILYNQTSERQFIRQCFFLPFERTASQNLQNYFKCLITIEQFQLPWLGLHSLDSKNLQSHARQVISPNDYVLIQSPKAQVVWPQDKKEDPNQTRRNYISIYKINRPPLSILVKNITQITNYGQMGPCSLQCRKTRHHTMNPQDIPLGLLSSTRSDI